MGKQVNFIGTEVDHLKLLVVATSLGMKAVPNLIKRESNPPVSIPTEYVLTPETGQRYFYLLPPEFPPADAFYKEVSSAPGLFQLLSNTSPVVQFSPSKRDNDRWEAGRIFFEPNSQDPRNPVAKKYFDKLAAQIKKWKKAKEFKRAIYLGPDALARSEEGKIRLTLWGRNLTPEP